VKFIAKTVESDKSPTPTSKPSRDIQPVKP